MTFSTTKIEFLSVIAVVIFLLSSNSSIAWTIEVDGAGAIDESSAVDSSCDLFGKQSFTSTGGLTFFTDEQSASNDIGLRVSVTRGSLGFGEFGGIIDFDACVDGPESKLVRGDELWIRARVFVPDSYEWNGGRNKFFRFRTYYYEDSGTLRSAGYNDLYIDSRFGMSDFQPFQFIYEGDAEWLGIGEREDSFQRNVWKTIEMYIKLDHLKRSEGGDAIVRVWIDGRLAKESFDRRTLNRANGFIESFNLFTYYSNNGAPKDQSLYIDDLVLTNETPASSDSSGNRFIGMGGFQAAIPSRPPVAR